MKILKAFFVKNGNKLIICLVIGIVITILFSGKSSQKLQSVAVSANEKYIAYLVSYDEVRCFHADGSLVFEVELNDQNKSGGSGSLWFEDGMLYVLFYRPQKVVQLTMDGRILNISDWSSKDYPNEFPGFIQNGGERIFSGSAVSVVYDEKGFLEYWFCGEERTLSIIPKDAEPIPIWIGIAQNSSTRDGSVC